VHTDQESEAESVLLGLSGFRHVKFPSGCMKCGASLSGEHVYDWEPSYIIAGRFFLYAQCPNCHIRTVRIYQPAIGS
jgi:hypothetical protein